MQMTAHEVLEAARQLLPADQLWFARMLLRAEGVSTREEIDEAWAIEVARRIADAESESAATLAPSVTETELRDNIADPSSSDQPPVESVLPNAVESPLA